MVLSVTGNKDFSLLGGYIERLTKVNKDILKQLPGKEMSGWINRKKLSNLFSWSNEVPGVFRLRKNF